MREIIHSFITHVYSLVPSLSLQLFHYIASDEKQEAETENERIAGVGICSRLSSMCGSPG